MSMMNSCKSEAEMRKKKKQDLRKSVQEVTTDLQAAQEENEALGRQLDDTTRERDTLDDKLRVAAVRISDLESEK